MPSKRSKKGAAKGKVEPKGDEDKGPQNDAAKGKDNPKEDKAKEPPNGSSSKQAPDKTPVEEQKTSEQQPEAPGKGVKVFITGCTSFVGFAITMGVLEAGYEVRCPIRKSEPHMSFIQAVPHRFRKQLRLIYVKNHLPEKDELADVLGKSKFIIHVIAGPPLWKESDSTWGWEYISAVTINSFDLLVAAHKSKHVKRIIFTSSIYPFFPLEQLDGRHAAAKYIKDEHRPFEAPKIRPTSLNNKLEAYACGQSRAMSLVTDIRDSSSKFDIVILMMSNVFGPNRLCKTVKDFYKGSNAILLNHLFGRPGPRLFTTSVHIDDVVRCHVDALLPCVHPGRYILNSGFSNWRRAAYFVKKHHPELVGTLFARKPRCKITRSVIRIPVTIHAFMLRFKRFEEQVKDTVDFYLSLLPLHCDRTRLVPPPQPTGYLKEIDPVEFGPLGYYGRTRRRSKSLPARTKVVTRLESRRRANSVSELYRSDAKKVDYILKFFQKPRRSSKKAAKKSAEVRKLETSLRLSCRLMPSFENEAPPRTIESDDTSLTFYLNLT